MPVLIPQNRRPTRPQVRKGDSVASFGLRQDNYDTALNQYRYTRDNRRKIAEEARTRTINDQEKVTDRAYAKQLITDNLDPERVKKQGEATKLFNATAYPGTTPWEQLGGQSAGGSLIGGATQTQGNSEEAQARARNERNIANSNRISQERINERNNEATIQSSQISAEASKYNARINAKTQDKISARESNIKDRQERNVNITNLKNARSKSRDARSKSRDSRTNQKNARTRTKEQITQAKNQLTKEFEAISNRNKGTITPAMQIAGRKILEEAKEYITKSKTIKGIRVLGIQQIITKFRKEFMRIIRKNKNIKKGFKGPIRMNEKYRKDNN